MAICSELQEGVKVVIEKRMARKGVNGRTYTKKQGKVLQRTKYLVIIQFQNYKEGFDIGELARGQDVRYKIVK